MNFVASYLLPSDKTVSWLGTMLINSQKPFYNYIDYFETMLAQENDMEKVNTYRNLHFGNIPDPFIEPDTVFDPAYLRTAIILTQTF